MSLLLSSLATLAERLGVGADSDVLVMALTHSSYAAEHGVESNERLEFLGDAVVDLAIADLLVRDFPELNEGASSITRSRIVNEASLAAAASRLELGAFLRLGRGVVKEGGAQRASILADAFEAVVAALYLERGYDEARAFVQQTLAHEVHVASTFETTLDPKTELRQWAERHGYPEPTYELRAHGPSHDTRFEASVTLGSFRASAVGSSKKRAEAAAAQCFLEERRDA